MKREIQNELVMNDVPVIALILGITLLYSIIMRILVEPPFLLPFSGYLLILFSLKKTGINWIERIASSFGVSIVIKPLFGLVLNYNTHWGRRLEPVLCPISSFVFITSIVAWFRRKWFPAHNGSSIELKSLWIDRNTLSNLLSLILVISILGTLGTLAYTVAFPNVSEAFSEFYILGTNGRAADYPTLIEKGKPIELIVGVVNHEQAMTSYRVEVRTIDKIKVELGPVILDNDGRWEQTVRFTLDTVGNDEKVEFLLYKNERPEPYSETHIWIDVISLNSP